MSTTTKRPGKPVKAKAIQLLTTQEVSDALGFAARTVRKWCQRGYLPAIQLGGGGDWFVDPKDLKGFKPPKPGAPFGNRNNTTGNPGPRKNSRKAS